jgi:hypothetical protein
MAAPISSGSIFVYRFADDLLPQQERFHPLFASLRSALKSKQADRL